MMKIKITIVKKLFGILYTSMAWHLTNWFAYHHGFKGFLLFSNVLVG